MENVILRTNAIPVYGFLSAIAARLPQGETLRGKKTGAHRVPSPRRGRRARAELVA